LRAKPRRLVRGGGPCPVRVRERSKAAPSITSRAVTGRPSWQSPPTFYSTDAILAIITNALGKWDNAVAYCSVCFQESPSGPSRVKAVIPNFEKRCLAAPSPMQRSPGMPCKSPWPSLQGSLLNVLDAFFDSSSWQVASSQANQPAIGKVLSFPSVMVVRHHCD
jgi:hypothetical protein